jgi:hypothetical protein
MALCRAPPPSPCPPSQVGALTLVACAVGAALLLPQALLPFKRLASCLGLHAPEKTTQWLFAGSGDGYFLVAGLAIFACLSSR